MTGPRGTPPPLDLAAIEARHKATMNGFSSDPGAYVESAADVPALLAHARALRAALQPFAAMYEPSDRDVQRMADTCPVQWQYDMYGTQGLTLGDLKRAAAVLAAAQDGPA